MRNLFAHSPSRLAATPRSPKTYWALALLTCAPLIGAQLACAPIVRPAKHRGADLVHAHTSLVGPYDGQIVDAQSGEAITEATVVASWDYDEGEGFIVPLGREVFSTRSDKAGRYRIPAAPLKQRSATGKLVSFTLSIAKPGYLPYRSDQTSKGQPRRDFAQRNHTVRLTPTLPSNSAMTQLLYLRSPAARTLADQAALRKRANLELYRIQSGLSPAQALPAEGQAPKTVTEPPKVAQWLDASALLDADGLRTRTGSYSEFTVQDLADLPRSANYHGVHFRAKDLDVRHDFAYRVWFEPPEGLGAIRELLKENLPNAQPSELITEQSWTFENEELRAVAFVDPAANAAVLLTCGVELCKDLDTAVLVAHHLARSLDTLKRIDAPEDSAAKQAQEPAPKPEME